MLQFYYDFLDVFVDRTDFEYSEMDTDSAYMALAGPDFQSVIKQGMREHYHEGLTGYCRDEVVISDDCKNHWFPRSCCGKHAEHDRRCPGLFKVEFTGTSMIGLSSNTYIASKHTTVATSGSYPKARRLVKRSARFHRHVQTQRFVAKSRTVTENTFSSKGIIKRSVKARLSVFG